MQRRVEQWRTLHGPAREVMFLQDHRLFHSRLPFSGWCHVAVIHGGESQLRQGDISLSSLRDPYGLRPPRGLTGVPQLAIPEDTLSSDDELLGGASQLASSGTRQGCGVCYMRPSYRSP